MVPHDDVPVAAVAFDLTFVGSSYSDSSSVVVSSFVAGVAVASFAVASLAVARASHSTVV